MNHTSSSSTPKTVRPFQPQDLRQSLEWIQTSPTLFSRAASVWMTDCPLPCGVPPLSLHDGMISKLAERIKQRNNPLLGIYYETLWQWLLEQHPDFELLAHNLQVGAHQKKTLSAETASVEHPAPSPGRTLGEFDLIYRCQGSVFHRELAVKFYLGLPSALTGLERHRTSPWHHWIGPGLRDRLDRKLNRLIHHQINLSDHPESQQTLNLMGIKALPEKEILIQGRLFYPLLAPDEQLEPGDGLQRLLTASGKAAPLTKHFTQHFTQHFTKHVAPPFTVTRIT